MKKQKITFFTLHALWILSFTISLQLCYAMEQESYKVLIVPGQNGLGGGNIPNIGLFPENTEYVDVPTPTGYFSMDLGQSGCQKEFKKALVENEGAKIIHASSQGTATVLNTLAQLDTKEIAQCKGIILEAVMGSGNSAIHHTVHHQLMNIPKFPGSYYLSPYFAKVRFPCYSPAGQQAIFSVEKIPNNLPVIIIHATQDPQLSLNDDQALYYKLREQGNNNVYLIRVNKKAHINLLKEFLSCEVYAIQKIMGIQKSFVWSDLSLYQPDYTQFKQHHDLLVTRENRIRMISKVFPWLFLFGGLTLLYKYILLSTVKETLSIANLPSLGATFRTNFCSALVGGMKEQNGVHNL